MEGGDLVGGGWGEARGMYKVDEGLTVGHHIIRDFQTNN